MTHKELAVFSKGLAPVLRDYVAQQMAPLETRIKDLEQRLRDAETKVMRFEGVWQREKTYGIGAAVVRSGSLWIALRPTCGTPGGPNEVDRDWQLAVKRGAA
jgi:hypothetical protein